MGAGKHIVESVPGLILLMLFGWAIIRTRVRQVLCKTKRCRNWMPANGV